jgi:hypothetical protein
MITALCPGRWPNAASDRNNSGRANPPSPSAPIFRKLRREIPSQNREPEPSILKIRKPFFCGHKSLRGECRETQFPTSYCQGETSVYEHRSGRQRMVFG